MSDLDRLEALRAAATPGEWVEGIIPAVSDAPYVTTLHNADLIGRIRELEGREAKLRELAEALRARAEAIAEANPTHVIHIEQCRQHASMIAAILAGKGEPT